MRRAWVMLALAWGCGGGTQPSPVDASAPVDGGGPTDAATMDATGTPDGAPAIDAGPFCGNGDVSSGEVCDDGNHDDGDGCSASCILEDQGAGGTRCSVAKVLTFVSTADETSSAIATGDTTDSINNGEGSCQTGAIDHVYELQLPEPAALYIEVTSTIGNPILYLRATRCVDPLMELGCADETGSVNTETLTFATLPAGRYYLFLDTGPGNARLAYQLTVVRTP